MIQDWFSPAKLQKLYKIFHSMVKKELMKLKTGMPLFFVAASHYIII